MRGITAQRGALPDELIAVPPNPLRRMSSAPDAPGRTGGHRAFSLTGWIPSGIPSFFGDQSVAARHEAGVTANPCYLARSASAARNLSAPATHNAMPRLPSETTRGTCNSGPRLNILTSLRSKIR